MAGFYKLMNDMEVISKIVRSKDVISNGELESLYKMDSFPVFIGCTHGLESDDIKSDMC